jgi:uncharacterized membrane protein
MDDYGKSSLGFDENIVAAASYICIAGPILLFWLEKKSDFVKFHALQSTIGFALLGVLWMLVRLVHGIWFLWWAPGLLSLYFSLSMMYRAYYGEQYQIPVIGPLAMRCIYNTDPEAAESEV